MDLPKNAVKLMKDLADALDALAQGEIPLDKVPNPLKLRPESLRCVGRAGQIEVVLSSLLNDLDAQLSVSCPAVADRVKEKYGQLTQQASLVDRLGESDKDTAYYEDARLRGRENGFARWLREAVDVPDGVPAVPTPTVEQAYQSYERAEKVLAGRLGRRPTDQEAYRWLQEHDTEEYELPKDFDTWAKYVRTGRRYYGTQKNTPRAGQPSNLPTADGIDSLGKISNSFAQEAD